MHGSLVIVLLYIRMIALYEIGILVKEKCVLYSQKIRSE